MRKGWLLVSLLSQSAACQHGDLRTALPLAARRLATVAKHMAAGLSSANARVAQPSCQCSSGVRSATCQPADTPCWRGFAAAADAEPNNRPGPSPAKLRAVPFTVTREEAAREYEAYHRSNRLFKQPSNGACGMLDRCTARN